MPRLFSASLNPVSQGEKFDPNGTYVRRWCPELANLPNGWIDQPYAAPKEILSANGIELDKTYPQPIVSHVIAREVALETFARIKNPGSIGRPSSARP